MEQSEIVSNIIKELRYNMYNPDIYPFLSKKNSTVKERKIVIKKLLELGIKYTHEKSLLPRDISSMSKKGLYVHTAASKFSITEIEDNDALYKRCFLLEDHDFTWWKKILKIKEPIIDNSELTKETWLDNQLKQLENGK